MFNGIDLTSDTATKPSLGMREAMSNALVGDEQRGEDETTLKLETMVAHMLGSDCAIFLPSATMANNIAIMALTKPGDVLIAAENAHLLQAECGGVAIHARVLTQPILTNTGIFEANRVLPYLNKLKKINYPPITAISIENTSNFGGGQVWPLDHIHQLKSIAQSNNLKLHMDGSRLFNAAVKLGIEAKTIAHDFDMITLCLSKGLGCPVGALLVYKKSYASAVQYYKKLMGGAMRQTGILTAAGIYALENNIQKLTLDHEHAFKFAETISTLVNEITLPKGLPATNIVHFSLTNPTNINAFIQHCENHQVRFSQISATEFRAVFHLDITQAKLSIAIDAVMSFFKK